MRRTSWMLMIGLLAIGACADAGDDAADADTETPAAATDAVEEPMADDMEADAAAEASFTLLDVNSASADELRAAGVPDAAVAAITGARPFDGMLAVDAALANVLDEAGREAAYRSMWIPIDLNTASREEIMLIPGVGNRMAGEFEEYRPYEGGMEEFRREIGKYVDDEEVERLAAYVTVE